jgi:hypothetical protein
MSLAGRAVGWTTRLVLNGSVFRQEWEDFQFVILGANGLTEIKNANQAQINGFEMDLGWRRPTTCDCRRVCAVRRRTDRKLLRFHR